MHTVLHRGPGDGVVDVPGRVEVGHAQRPVTVTVGPSTGQLAVQAEECMRDPGRHGGGVVTAASESDSGDLTDGERVPRAVAAR